MKKFNSLVLSTITAAFLVGCGGSSSGTTPTISSDSTIGGTVAIGLGISAQIEIMDVSTCEIISTTSNSSGMWEYSGNLSSYTGPFLLKASSTLGFSMYSYLDLASGIVANITPFTHYSTDAASRALPAGTSIASMYASCNRDSGGLSGNIGSFNSYLSTTLSNLRTNLSANFPGNNYANENPFTVPFIANQSGYDALLDSTDISLNNNDTVIRLGTQILETSDTDITTIPTMYITSNVVDSSGDSLADVTVSIDTRNSLISFDPISATSTSGGSYSLNVDQYRDYVITYSKEGYTTVTQNYSTFSSGINPATVTMFTTEETLSMTAVTPTLNITDSRNGDTLSSVTIKIREGYNNRLGDVQNSINSSDGTGLSLTPGTYTLELNKTGYENKYLTVTITSTTTSINADLLSINTSSTVNSNAFATIIVRWGENPVDIDSHLLFNNTDVYFGNTSNGGIPIDKSNPCATSSVVASLDLDDTDSYGPETTTICDGTAGPFAFKLHHFSGSSNIGASPTTVELITRDGSRYEFVAPTTGFAGDDDVWDVFTLSTDQSVTRTNTIDSSSSLNNNINLTTSMFVNKTYRLTDSTNSYVVFEFYSDGTGKETGYSEGGNIEYSEEAISWSISDGSGLLNIVLSDSTIDSYYFGTNVANGNIVYVNTSDEESIPMILSDYSDILID
jgi:hypothetical protein